MPESSVPAAKVRLTWRVESEAKALLSALAPGWKQGLGRLVRAIWKEERGDEPVTIAVVFVPEQRIRDLNREFRGKDATTDVLTFDLGDPSGGREGEIYVCPDQAAQQLDQYGTSFGEEICRLVIHGVLHLAGHDHHTLSGGKRMAALTRRHLRVLSSEGSFPPA